MAEAEPQEDAQAGTPAEPAKPEPTAEPTPEPTAEPEPEPEPKPEPTPEPTETPAEAEHDRGQRKVRNYLLQPPFQVQLVIYNCILALTFAAAVVGVLWRIQSRLAYRMDLIGVPDGLRETLDSALGDSAIYLVVLGLIFVGASASITIILTHRMVGPAYAFRRQINELTSGKYGARINLRDNDAFTEVADDLNRLAETLEREHGGLSNKGTILTMDD